MASGPGLADPSPGPRSFTSSVPPNHGQVNPRFRIVLPINVSTPVSKRQRSFQNIITTLCNTYGCVFMLDTLSSSDSLSPLPVYFSRGFVCTRTPGIWLVLPFPSAQVHLPGHSACFFFKKAGLKGSASLAFAGCTPRGHLSCSLSLP